MANQYIKLPDGSYAGFPDNMSDEDIHTALVKGGLIKEPVLTGEAGAAAAQARAEDTAAHPWRDIIANAPSNLKNIAAGVVPSIVGGVTSMAEPFAYANSEGPAYQPPTAKDFPTVEALKTGVAHPSRVAPAVQKFAGDQDKMNALASNLTGAALTAGITDPESAAEVLTRPGGTVNTMGRLVTRPLAWASGAPDALARSIPLQKGVVGGVGATTLAAAGAPAAVGMGGDVALGALGAGAAESKLGSILPGVSPSRAAVKMLDMAGKAVDKAVENAGGNIKAPAVIQAEADVAAARQIAGPTTGVGKLATKTADLMRAPDRFMTSRVPPPTNALGGNLVPGPVSPTLIPTQPNVIGGTTTAELIYPPTNAIGGNIPPGPVTPTMLTRPPVPGAPVTPPMAPPSSYAPPGVPPPVSALDRLYAQANPQFKALQDAGAFSGDRTTGAGGMPPSAGPDAFSALAKLAGPGGGGAEAITPMQSIQDFAKNPATVPIPPAGAPPSPGGAPAPAAPPPPPVGVDPAVVALGPQAVTADAAATSNRVAAGVITDVSPTNYAKNIADSVLGRTPAGDRAAITSKLESPDDVMHNVLSKTQPNLNDTLNAPSEAQPGPGPSTTSLSSELGPVSTNVHGAAGLELPEGQRATNANIKAHIESLLKNPNATMADIRAVGGADRLGAQLAPSAPDASTGGVLRSGPTAPSWMPDAVQKDAMSDIQTILNNPSAHGFSAAKLAKIRTTLGQLTDQYLRNGGPRPSPTAQALHDLLSLPTTRATLHNVLAP